MKAGFSYGRPRDYSYTFSTVRVSVVTASLRFMPCGHCMVDHKCPGTKQNELQRRLLVLQLPSTLAALPCLQQCTCSTIRGKQYEQSPKRAHSQIINLIQRLVPQPCPRACPQQSSHQLLHNFLCPPRRQLTPAPNVRRHTCIHLVIPLISPKRLR